MHLTLCLLTPAKQRVCRAKTSNYICLTNLLCVTQQFTKLLLFTVSAQLQSAKRIKQCFDNLTLHLTAHTGLRSAAKYLLPVCLRWILVVWCLAMSPNPPTRVLNRSQPLFLSLSLSLSLVVQLGSTFFLDFCFQCAYFGVLIRKKKALFPQSILKTHFKTNFNSQGLERSYSFSLS